MPYQTSYQDRMNAAYEGMPVESGLNDVHSMTYETAGSVGFGKAVTYGSADKMASLGGTVFAGIVVADKASPNDNHVQYDTIGAKRKGKIWVRPTEAVVAGDSVYFTAATGAISKTAAGNILIAGATFDTGAAANGLALVFLG